MSVRSDRFELRDRSDVWIRPIGAADKRLLAEAFDRLSEESRYRRFLHPVKELQPRDLAYFTELDHHDHEALVALDAAGEVVAVARYIRSTSDYEEAEFAIAVVDEWQGRGLGTELLIQLMTKARSEGVRRFTATALSDNREVRELVEHVAPVLSRHSTAGVIELEIGLPDEPHLLITESPG
jgi:RimJ/RimL family protein N-acetyltransferase